MTISVAIVSPYASVRAGLAALLADFDEAAIVSSSSSAADLADADVRADAILVDVVRREVSDIARLAQQLEAALIVLADDASDLHSLASMPIRGLGYLSREADGPEIAGAIHAAAAGLIAVDRRFAGDLPSGSERLIRIRGSAADEQLTARELEVLQLLAQGLPNKTIAARLNVTPNTAKFHVASILSKLGAASRTEAVTIGARHGLVSL